MTGSLAADKPAGAAAVSTARHDVTQSVSQAATLQHTEEQEPFQPGSTPANQKSRYMVSTQSKIPIHDEIPITHVCAVTLSMSNCKVSCRVDTERPTSRFPKTKGKSCVMKIEVCALIAIMVNFYAR